MEALIIVDMQNDFCEGGAIIPITDTDKICQVINSIIPYFEIVIFTQDWHPSDHISFDTNGGKFHSHCIQGTDGAKIVENISRDFKNRQRVYYIKKGYDSKTESFSAFYDSEGVATGLPYLLKSQNVEEIYVCGVAGEYCIKATLLDAIKDDFLVNLIRDGTGFMSDNKEEIDEYYNYYKSQGVWTIDSMDIKNFLDEVK
jgi:nicotinamidase/pyrazinamidase